MSENQESESVEIVQITDANIVYSQDKATIDVMISTAKAFPRNIQRAKKNAIDIVTMDEATAEVCNYTLPRGSKSITGPSVHLAKILAQCWGNLRMEAKVVDISATQVTSEGVCFDLENNIAMKASVKKSIMQHETKWVNGKSVKTGRMIRMNDDMITMIGNAINSIALRNAIFSVIPRPIIDSAYNAALKTITGDLSDDDKLKKKARTVVNKLMATFNVTEEQVLSVINKASVDFITAEDVAVLIGIGTAIKEGDSTVETAFGNKNTDSIKPDTATNPNDRAKELISTSKTLKELNQRVSTMSDALKEFFKEEIADKTESFTEKK